MRGGERIEGLDAWRAIMMIGGLAVHASLLKPSTPLFDLIGIVSGTFRMGAFFAISGLLAGLALARRDPAAWLRRRTFQIGVPAVFALVVLCPIGTAVMFAMPSGTMPHPPALLDWQHAWFLVALLLYAPIAAALDRARKRGSLPSTGGADRDAALRCLILAGLPLMSFALMEGTVLVIANLAPASYWVQLSQWKFIVGYAPVYVFGFALARSFSLRRAMLGSLVAPATIVIGVLGVYSSWYWGIAATAWGQANAWVASVLVVLGSAVAPPAAAVLIVRSAMALPPIPPILTRLSDAGFTMYLVHFPLFMALNLGFAHVAWNQYVEYAIVLFGGGGLTFLIHTHIVCRWPIAALLLNGKRLEPSQVPAADPKAGPAAAPG